MASRNTQRRTGEQAEPYAERAATARQLREQLRTKAKAEGWQGVAGSVIDNASCSELENALAFGAMPLAAVLRDKARRDGYQAIIEKRGDVALLQLSDNIQGAYEKLTGAGWRWNRVPTTPSAFPYNEGGLFSLSDADIAATNGKAGKAASEYLLALRTPRGTGGRRSANTNTAEGQAEDMAVATGAAMKPMTSVSVSTDTVKATEKANRIAAKVGDASEDVFAQVERERDNDPMPDAPAQPDITDAGMSPLERVKALQAYQAQNAVYSRALTEWAEREQAREERVEAHKRAVEKAEAERIERERIAAEEKAKADAEEARLEEERKAEEAREARRAEMQAKRQEKAAKAEGAEGAEALTATAYSVPDVDDTFILPATLEEVFKLLPRQMAKRGRAHNVLLIGERGCGKTSGVAQFAAREGLTLVVVDCSLIREGRDLYGRMQVRSNGAAKEADSLVYWEKSAFAEAIEQGSCVILFDELTRANRDVQAAILPLLDHRRQAMVEGQSVSIGEEVFVFGACNIGAEYHAAALEKALDDRFAIRERVAYLPEAQEAGLLEKRTGLDGKSCAKIARAGRITRDKASAGDISDSLSTRALLALAEALADGMPSAAAVRLCVANRYEDDGSNAGECAAVLQVFQSQI